MTSEIQGSDPSVLPNGLMDTKNAARYMGLKPKTLAMHRTAGTGPRFIKRGRVFYYPEDCDEWIREGRVVSTAQARQLNTFREGSNALAQVPATVPIPAKPRPSRRAAKRKPRK